MKNEKSLAENLGNFIIEMCIAVSISFLAGFVFMKLWGWFIVQTFGLHQLTFIQCMGFILVVGFFKGINYKEVKESDENKLEKRLYSITFYLIGLGLGYIYHLFI